MRLDIRQSSTSLDCFLFDGQQWAIIMAKAERDYSGITKLPGQDSPEAKSTSVNMDQNMLLNLPISYFSYKASIITLNANTSEGLCDH